MAKSALEKWKEENRQNKPVASSGTNKLEQWKQENRQNKPVTVPAPSAAAAPVIRGPSATSVYGSANRTAPMGVETRNTLMAAATEIAARQAEEQRRKKQQEAFMSNPRASTAYTRQAYNTRYSEDDRAIGRYGAGNIDLYNRPQYRNEDGSISTVDSIGFNIDGQEVLLPTVWMKDGKPYHSYDDEEILNHYRETGEYLGKFNTLEESNAYGEKLHRAQEYYYSGANKAEKQPMQDRAKKVAEIRKDIDTTPVQGRVGKGLQSIGLSTPASIEYLGESAKQVYKNQQAYEESDLQQQIAEAYSNLNLTERQYGWGSPEYEQARQNYDAVVAQLNAFKNAPDKAVDMDSRAAQFMGRVQKLQEEALEGTSGAGRFLGEAALSIGSNLAKLPANAIIPGASLALMGAEAAAGKAYELGQQGVNAGQALTRGLVSGGIEVLTEKIPLDNLVDIIKTGGKTGLMNVLKQAVTEAGEEGVAYLLNLGADKVAGDPEAEFVWNDFIRSMGLGALSGGVMGGGATAINRANAAAVGKNYQDVAPELVAEGLQMNQDTDAYRTATEMQRKLDAGKTLSDVDVGRMVQDNETTMAPLRQAAMEMAEAEVEREVQAAMPKRTVVQPLATAQRMAYTESNRTTEGGMTDGEEVHLRESGQRNDRAYPGGEVSRMEEGAGRDQSWQDSRLPAKDAGAADLRVGEEVSTASLGIGNGASNDRIRVVTGGDTEATAKARAIAKERGLRLTLFAGGNLTINGEECRAYITGDRAFVRADHSDFDADQLMRHEAGHEQIAKGEIDIKAATENIRKRLGGRNYVRRAAQAYAYAFAGADMTVEEAIEEIICDSLGDMNVFSDTAFETSFGEVLESAKAAAGESRVEIKTGPPTEGKASKEHWRTDLNKRQFQALLDVVKKDVKTTQNRITNNANWLFTNIGNSPVFSIYSTLDQNEPTVLYEVKGEQALFEKAIVDATIKEVNRAGHLERKAEVVNRLLNGNWVRKGGGVTNGSGAVGGRSDGGNAGLLLKQSERKPSAAFESVLRNLFQVQETESVNENLAALGVESDDGSVGKASRESWSRTDKQKLASELISAGFEKTKVEKWIDDVNSISALIAGDPNRLDYDSAPGLSSFVSNAEYGGSFDFSTLCKKRRLLTGTFTAIQKALPDTALTADEILEIRRMMAEADLEVSCGLCYVEGSRANMGQFTQEFIRLYKKYNPGKWAPNMAEMNTPDGIEWVRINHPEVYKEYEYFWNHFGKLRNEDKNLFAGQKKPKLYQMRTEYKGEILERFKRDGNVAEKNRKGGLRLQSFSDFETPHLIDTMQIIMDMADVGLAGQAYTKVPNFAWAFGDTGLKINLSLIAKDVDADGKLVFDEKEGMPIADAMALRDRYSENVGTIIVVFTDDQLKAAMADERIDFIIPFHRSQWKKSQYAAMGLPAKTKDYTYQQNEKLIKPTYHEYRGKMVKDKAANYMPNDYWDFSKSGKENAEDYLKMCAANNKRPKFYNLLVNNGDGSYSLQPDGSTDGYWKLLIDFKMYDNNGSGSPQMPVVPEFNMEEANRIMNEYEGGHAQFPVAQGIVDKFLKKKLGKASRETKRGDVLRAVEQLLQEYGAIEPGENPFRSVQVPKQTGEGKNVSKTVRTILEAEATPEAIIPNVEELVADGALSFESYTDEQAIADSTAKLQGKGWSKTLSNWLRDMDKGIVSKENTVTGWALYNNAANSGDTETALTIFEKMVGHQRNAAQALQATRVLKKLSPETQLYGVQRSVQDLQDELNKKYGDDKAPQLKIDPDLGKKFLEATTEQERDDALKEIYHDVGRQMPSTFKDKWNAWRYLAMLGNPRTHVRNIVGNAGFAPLVAAKNLTATAIESAVGSVAGNKMGRTKAFVGTSAADRALLKASWDDYANVADEISNGGKYSDFQNANKQIEAGRVIFKNKALEKARTFNSAALEKEDTWFSKPHYAAALASYCKANGITVQQIAKGGKAMDKARAYAIKEAQKATYRDTNALSQAFGEIGGKWRTSSNPIKKGVGIAIEGILPFRKTPANILARGVEYSPIGLMNGIKKAVWDVQKGNATAAEAIDNISAGLTGTMLMALGAFLAAQGLIRGGGEGDDKEKEFAELQGHQTYAMELPNGKSVTLDWLAPEALPFFIGVNFYESTQGKKEEMDIDSIIGSVTSITEPLLEMSCLQGLNDLIDSVGYASSRDVNSLVAMAASAATSYLTQALPTLGGQLERSFQKERMTTYSDKNKRWIPADLQYTIGKASAKIPGLDYQQIPYIDAWGRTESTGSFAENAFGNLLNPSYTSQIDTTAMEDELLRLYRSTGESVFPSRAARYFMVNNERKDLTAEEYVQYATLKGRYSYELLTDLVDSSTYKSLTDAEKAKMVLEVFDNANKQAKAAISEYELDDWAAKYAEAEKKYGIKQEVFAEVRMNTRFLASLKDKNGETITNSLSLLKMEAVYNIPGLTDKQRQALFDYLDVGKSVRHYNKSLVKQKLADMRKKAK